MPPACTLQLPHMRTTMCTLDPLACTHMHVHPRAAPIATAANTCTDADPGAVADAHAGADVDSASAAPVAAAAAAGVMPLHRRVQRTRMQMLTLNHITALTCRLLSHSPAPRSPPTCTRLARRALKTRPFREPPRHSQT
eukprot:357945-Chlamydomonas_euryale.AAC.6